MKLYYILMSIMTFLFIQGCSTTPQPEVKMDKIVKKIVEVETPNGKYTTVNKKSGAYGRYQIMPKTAKHYAKKLNISHRKWKHPKNQDKIFRALLEDNITMLKKKGYSVTAFNVYGCHQQGATGFDNIMKNKNMSKKMYFKLGRNVPGSMRCTNKKELRKRWIVYWENKMRTDS